MSYSKPHLLKCQGSVADMIGYVSQHSDDLSFWHCGSASGPLGTGITDEGELSVGQAVILQYDYVSDEYSDSEYEVVRINRKSITAWSTRHNEKVRIPL